LVQRAQASAPPGRYTMNYATVIDTITNLTWQRTVPSEVYTWDAAKNYCTGLSLGGIGAGGWRLPRKLELESLVNDESNSSAIDTTAFPNTPSNYFWSSSPSAATADYAWYVDFSSGSGVSGGGSRVDNTSKSYPVRCVH
jgi:hypothetical protein